MPLLQLSIELQHLAELDRQILEAESRFSRMEALVAHSHPGQASDGEQLAMLGAMANELEALKALRGAVVGAITRYEDKALGGLPRRRD